MAKKTNFATKPPSHQPNAVATTSMGKDTRNARLVI
jgi:hypothetical protein